MSDERRPPSECRWARQVSALLLIAVVVVIVVLDVIVDDHEVNPPVIVPLLLTAVGSLSVDLPPGERTMSYAGQRIHFPAAHDYGSRDGWPTLAVTWHMAEGRDVAQYLAGDPLRGVSVHYTV